MDNLQLLNNFANSEVETIYKYNSGLNGLDAIVGGFRSKQLYVVSARAGVGKTSLLVTIFTALARQHVKSFLFSLELSKEEIACRFARNMLLDKDFQFDNLSKMKELLEKHKTESHEYLEAQKNIFSMDGSMSITTIEEVVAKHCHEIHVFGIDYTGLIYIPTTSDTPDWKRLGMIVEQLKRIANQYNIVLFLINHLNRAIPTGNAMSEQGGSIDFERLATCIMQIYSDERDKSKRTIKITKNRMGITGECTLFFNGAYDCFYTGESF